MSDTDQIDQDDDSDVPTFGVTDGDDATDGAAAAAQEDAEGKVGDDWDDHDAPGSGPRRRREISPKTRELFRKASTSVKAQLDAGASTDAFEVAIEDPDDAAAEEQELEEGTAGEQPAAAEEKPPEGTPPAPGALDPRVVEAWEEVNEQRRTIAAEREELTRLRAENDVDALRERFVESPGSVGLDLIKRFAPWADEREIREIAIDLVTEISGSVLGVTIQPEAQERLSRRASDRSVKAWRAQQAAEKASAPKKAAAEQQAARERQAVQTIDQELKAAADQFPFLALEQDAADQVWGRIKAAYLRDGTKLEPKEAAATLEKEFKTKASGWFAARRHLFTAAPGSDQAQPKPRSSVPQGDPSSIRRSRTLTNGQAASAPNAPRTVEVDEAKAFDPRAHRARSLGKLRAGIKQKTGT